MSLKYSVVCDTLGFIGYDVLEQPEMILETIKEAGYDDANLPCNPKLMAPRKLRPVVDSVGLEVPELLGAWAHFHAGEDRNLASGDEESRQQSLSYARASIDLCAAMGAQFFEMCATQPAVPQIPFPKLPVETLRDNFVSALREICQCAAKQQITVLLEPLNLYEGFPGVLTTIYEAMQIIERTGMDGGAERGWD